MEACVGHFLYGPSLVCHARRSPIFPASFAFVLSPFPCSLILVLDDSVEALAGVYALSFLCVMALFTIGNMLLKVLQCPLPYFSFSLCFLDPSSRTQVFETIGFSSSPSHPIPLPLPYSSNDQIFVVPFFALGGSSSRAFLCRSRVRREHDGKSPRTSVLRGLICCDRHTGMDAKRLDRHFRDRMKKMRFQIAFDNK